MTAESIQDVTSALKKALIERALSGELSHHPGYPPVGDKPAEAGNHRNGSTGKTVLTEGGSLALIELLNGTDAPSFVAGTENFYVITRYNWSSYYAMAVIDLGQEIASRFKARP